MKDSVIGSQSDRNTHISSVVLVSEMANVTSYQRLNIQMVESEKNYYKNSRDTCSDLNIATMLISMLRQKLKYSISSCKLKLMLERNFIVRGRNVAMYGGMGNGLQKPWMLIQLEHTMPITLHANGEPFLKWSSSYSHSFQSTTILLVVWSANGDGSAITSRASSKVNLLNDATYH